MDWTNSWLWIAIGLGVAGGIVMFIPLARVLRWRARMLERMERAPNRTGLSIRMEAGTFGWTVAGAICFLFLPTMLLPRPTGIFYLGGFIIGMAYRRPRFNREMEASGLASHASRRIPESKS